MLRWEQAVDAIRRADAVLPPGLITSEAWERARRATTVPAWRWIVAAADNRGGMAHLIRAALPVAARVEHERLTPLNREELTFVMADAVGRGFVMGCASQRWRASDPASPRLCPKTVQRHALLAGASALEIYVAAGGAAPPAPLPPLYPRRPKGPLPASARRERARRREARGRHDVARELENYLAAEDRWPPSAKWKRDGMYALHQRAVRYATRDEWCAELGLLPPATERVDRQTDEQMEAALRALLRELKPDVWPRLAVIAFHCGPGFTNRLIARASAKDWAARFGLPRAPDRSRRAQIETGLLALVDRLGRWPTRKDFEAEELMLLYFDVQYGGGTTWWRARIKDMGYDV